MTPAITPPLDPQAEASYHFPVDLLERSNRRLAVLVLGLGLAVIASIAGLVSLAMRGRPSYVVALIDGQEYVVSNPTKRIDIRDQVLYQQVRQDLRQFAESYFERSATTAQRDHEAAQWFLDDDVRAIYNTAAQGPRGWIAQVAAHTLPESHVYINNVIARDQDIQRQPYLAAVYFTRTAADGSTSQWIAPITFVVRPDLAAKLPRCPLYNALGVFVTKQIDEYPEYKR